MKISARIISVVTITSLLGMNVQAAPKYIPVMTGQFSTGQWYFEGEESSLGGNADITFVPAVQFSNRFSLIPLISSQYRGTRSTEELAGGNTLFQDTWENTINLKGVRSMGQNWKARGEIGYKSKWFRETTDENWTNGLYDYQIYNVGGELERTFSKKSNIALGYDFSLLQFPNYDSLEASQSVDLQREFAADNALDNVIHMVSARAESPFLWGIQNGYNFVYSPRFYRDQTIVNISGLLTSEKREDTYIGGSFSMERGFRTSLKTNLIPSVYYSFTSLDTNQNHYDARQTTFVKDYYDYNQHAFGMNLTFAMNGVGITKGPITFESGFSYSNRDYSDRVTQTPDSQYTSEKLYIQETNINFGFGYPLSKALRLRVTSNFGRSKSNNDYEAVYRYNYDNANYQFGFTYEY